MMKQAGGMRRIGQKNAFGTVLIELIVVILFFALSMSVVVQLIAAANELSNESAYASRAMFALQDMAEQLKADPVGDGDFDESGVRKIERVVSDDMIVSGEIKRKTADCGALYEISLRVERESGEPYLLDAARYVRGEATP